MGRPKGVEIGRRGRERVGEVIGVGGGEEECGDGSCVASVWIYARSDEYGQVS